MIRISLERGLARATAPFVALAASVALSVSPSAVAFADGVHLEIEPSATSTSPGDTLTVTMRVFQADEEFNGFDINLGFDPAFLSYVPAAPLSAQFGELMTGACPNVFPVFSAGPNQLAITLVLLCANTFVTGPGVVYRVKFVVNAATGTTQIVCDPGTQFYRAGFFVSPLDCVPGEITVAPTGVSSGSEATAAGAVRLVARPNPYAGLGAAAISVALPRADRVRLDIYDSSGRLVARREPEDFAAGGARVLDWDPGALAPGVYFLRVVSDAGLTARTTWIVVR